jgi:FMN-dependent NADH-azoreductase
MATLLHLDSSPRGDFSISRKISKAAVEAWKTKNPNGKVIERDLTKSDLTFVNLDWIMGAFTAPETQSEAHKKALAISDELTAELLASDVIVIGVPMYNFAIPALLKAWVDHIVRAGKTFNYDANGVQGHVGGRKFVIAVASGGVYAGTPMEAYDHEIPYLRHILGFIGVTDITFVQAGGTMGVAQGNVSETDFLAPFLEKAEAAVS